MNRHHRSRRPLAAAAAIATATLLGRPAPAAAATYTWVNTGRRTFRHAGQLRPGRPASNDLHDGAELQHRHVHGRGRPARGHDRHGRGVRPERHRVQQRPPGRPSRSPRATTAPGRRRTTCSRSGGPARRSRWPAAGRRPSSPRSRSSPARRRRSSNAGAGTLSFSNVASGTPATTFAFASNGRDEHHQRRGRGRCRWATASRTAARTRSSICPTPTRRPTRSRSATWGRSGGTLNIASGAVGVRRDRQQERRPVRQRADPETWRPGRRSTSTSTPRRWAASRGAGNVLLTSAGATFVAPGGPDVHRRVQRDRRRRAERGRRADAGRANTYTGATTIQTGGTIRAAAAGVLSAGSAVTVSTNGTLDTGGFNQSVGGLAGGNANGTLPLGGGLADDHAGGCRQTTRSTAA